MKSKQTYKEVIESLKGMNLAKLESFNKDQFIRRLKDETLEEYDGVLAEKAKKFFKESERFNAYNFNNMFKKEPNSNENNPDFMDIMNDIMLCSGMPGEEGSLSVEDLKNFQKTFNEIRSKMDEFHMAYTSSFNQAKENMKNNEELEKQRDEVAFDKLETLAVNKKAEQVGVLDKVLKDQVKYPDSFVLRHDLFGSVLEKFDRSQFSEGLWLEIGKFKGVDTEEQIDEMIIQLDSIESLTLDEKQIVSSFGQKLKKEIFDCNDIFVEEAQSSIKEWAEKLDLEQKEMLINFLQKATSTEELFNLYKRKMDIYIEELREKAEKEKKAIDSCQQLKVNLEQEVESISNILKRNEELEKNIKELLSETRTAEEERDNKYEELADEIKGLSAFTNSVLNFMQTKIEVQEQNSVVIRTSFVLEMKEILNKLGIKSKTNLSTILGKELEDKEILKALQKSKDILKGFRKLQKDHRRIYLENAKHYYNMP